MAEAGVELAFDMTAHSVIGLSDVFKNYFKFRKLFGQLYDLALEREPDAIICVDFSGFNRRFAHAIKGYVRSRQDWFHDWNPKLIQYVSPQVWASRPGRAYQMARDYDLLLSIFPFEKEWYAKRVPQLKVEYVGHPIVDRYTQAKYQGDEVTAAPRQPGPPKVLLLPGSRPGELARHLPIMGGALDIMRNALPGLRALMVLPDQTLAKQAKAVGLPSDVDIQIGDLPRAFSQADVAIASTGTVTLECAWFGVPMVALYKTSWSTYQIGRKIVTVKYLAMPNLLANEPIVPEFIQGTATAENIARAALELLRDENRRKKVKAKLAEVVALLGSPGASRRAARSIVRLMESSYLPEATSARSQEGIELTAA
jgi:lipid-A-disaccharide synthase